MIQDDEFNFVSQNAHLLGGLIGVILPTYLFQFHYWYLIIIIICTGLKEFWYDYHYETSEVRGSSLEDFSFYMIGMVLGVGMVLFRGDIGL